MVTGAFIIPATIVIFLACSFVLTECIWKRRVPKTKRGPLSWRGWTMVIIQLVSIVLGAYVGEALTRFLGLPL